MKRLYYDYYFYRQETLWRKNALKTLPVLLNSSDMLACGEDLGLIPSCVHPVCLFHDFVCIFNVHGSDTKQNIHKICQLRYGYAYPGYARIGSIRFTHSENAK